MALFVRRSIPDRLLIVAFCLITVSAATPLASAQHPSGHITGGAAHISAPPIYHAPISSTPVFRAPIYTHPISTFRSTGGLGAARFFPPRRPIRPFPPVIVIYGFPFAFNGPPWAFNCWWANCDFFWPWTLDYTTVSSLGPANYVLQPNETPVPDYGEESVDTPQLYLKDGTILNVTDYWVVDNQLHFTIIQDYGAKPTEEVIPFEALDLQKSVDINTRRGFRFMLRNEPVEQYIRDHPEGPPPVLTPPGQ
jgi:hypothetical protein